MSGRACLARRSLEAAAALAAGLVLAASASAAETSFAGSCLSEGSFTFDTPVTYVPSATTLHLDDWRNGGHCDGVLGGVAVEHAPANLKSDAPGVVGCGSSSVEGPATLTFTNGTAETDDDLALALTWSLKGSLTDYVTQLSGLTGGQAVGRGRVGAGGAAFTQCAGEGVRQVDFYSEFSTLSPLVTTAVRPPARAFRARLRARRQRIGAVLRRGLVVTLKTSAPATASLTARLGRGRIGTARATISRARGGAARRIVRINTRGRRALRRAQAATLVVVARIRSATGHQVTRRARARVTRQPSVRRKFRPRPAMAPSGEA